MVLLLGRKLNADNLYIRIRNAVGGRIGKGMYPQLPRLDLVQQAGDILIILGLRLRQPRVLPHAFQLHLPANLTMERRNAGKPLPVHLAAGKSKHVPQVKGRVPYGLRIKWHIIHCRKAVQNIPA